MDIVFLNNVFRKKNAIVQPLPQQITSLYYLILLQTISLRHLNICTVAYIEFHIRVGFRVCAAV
jgi:hypothetical protein